MIEILKRIFGIGYREVPDIEEPQEESVPNEELINRIRALTHHSNLDLIFKSTTTDVYVLLVHTENIDLLIRGEHSSSSRPPVCKSKKEFFLDTTVNIYSLFSRFALMLKKNDLSENQINDITQIVDMFYFYLLEDL